MLSTTPRVVWTRDAGRTSWACLDGKLCLIYEADDAYHVQKNRSMFDLSITVMFSFQSREWGFLFSICHHQCFSTYFAKMTTW